jgi:hypothetical protein
MKHLLEYNNYRIEALLKELNKNNKRILELETFIFELCDRDCPEAYKQVIRTELYEYRQNNR